MNRLLLLLALVMTFGCDQEEATIPEPVEEEPGLYFPSINAEDWETTSTEGLNWDANQLTDLYEFLETNSTRAFIVLKDGRLVVEKYWGKNIAGTTPFGRETRWYWASAGKTLTAFLVGLAQEEGLLSIEDQTSAHLGAGWTSLSQEKEDLITLRHQLTMTTGLDFGVPDQHCTDPECLQFKANAGDQWYYHNAPYTLLEKVVGNASGLSYNNFTDDRLEKKIGMSGDWLKSGFNNVYWSTARDAARFGLLILNQGKWQDQVIMTDPAYFQSMVNSSQELNPAYGYLWWLNGESPVIMPGSTRSFNITLAPDGPSDLFAAMGKNGQFIDIVPSQNLVVIRMGEAPDDSLVPVLFHNEIWKKLGVIVGM